MANMALIRMCRLIMSSLLINRPILSNFHPHLGMGSRQCDWDVTGISLLRLRVVNGLLLALSGFLL